MNALTQILKGLLFVVLLGFCIAFVIVLPFILAGLFVLALSALLAAIIWYIATEEDDSQG